MFTFLYVVSTLLKLPLQYRNVYECVSAYTPGAWVGVGAHPYSFPLTFLHTVLQTQLQGRTDLSACSLLVADTCWRTTSDLEDIS